MIQVALYYLLVINVAAFVAYGIDKYKAKHDKWRIPEATLLWLAALGGALGALHGMRVWHHKTKHWKFKILVPLLLALWLAAIGYYLYLKQVSV